MRPIEESTLSEPSAYPHDDKWRDTERSEKYHQDLEREWHTEEKINESFFVVFRGFLALSLSYSL